MKGLIDAQERRRIRDRERYQEKREEILAYQAAYYRENSDRVKARVSQSLKLKRERLRRLAIELKGGACQDCGIDIVKVLQFHHREPAQKIAEVMTLATSEPAFWREVEKCDLLRN